MSKPTSISVILVAFNNSEDIISCLESLKEQTYPRFEVMVVDNASNQSEINHITTFITNQEVDNFKIKFITSDKNLGYTGGNNIGIRHALEHGAEEILVLNPDTTPDPHLLEEIHKTLAGDNRIGIVGPVIDEGTRKVYGGMIEWLKPELVHFSSPPNIFYPLPLNYFLTGACVLVKREVFEKIGLLDERYFLYFDDPDLCLRVQKAGFKLAISEKAKLYHKVAATTSKLGAARLLRYHCRNAHIFNMKHAPAWAFILLPFWSISIIIKQLLKLIVGKDKSISKEILLGVTDFYRGKFGKI